MIGDEGAAATDRQPRAAADPEGTVPGRPHREGPLEPVAYSLRGDQRPDPWAAGSGSRLWLVRVAANAEHATAAERLLDVEERARARNFVHRADRDRYRVAHVALRQLLGGYLDRAPAAVELIREPCPGCGGPHGRPAVSGAALHFSLSHSGDLVLLAFADAPVGVDVEVLPAPEAAADVAAALHPAERTALAALPGAVLPAAFARCWTRKEAYLKGIGTGLAEEPSATYVGAGSDPAQPEGWSLADVAVPSGYAAACAVRLPGLLTRRDH